jgi:hypothetical protein
MSKVGKIAKRLTSGSQPGRGQIANGGGLYRKGHKKIGGRKKGVQNTLTRELKEAIINAAIRLGADGNGKDGLEGYLMMLGREEKRTFGMLLRAVLPMQVNASVTTTVNVKYKTLEEASEEARKLGLPERRVYELTDFRRNEDEQVERPPAAKDPA